VLCVVFRFNLLEPEHHTVGRMLVLTEVRVR